MLGSPRSMLIAFTVWSVLALALLLPVTWLLKASFPIFTLVWIVVPLVVAWRTKDASQVGFHRIAWRELIQVTAVNLGILLAIMFLFEPWSHTYRDLLQLALSSDNPDSTFAWMLRFPRLPGLAAMTFYSGLVTLFGEELFFRGWLLQALRRKMSTAWAVVLQAALFVLPNLLVAFTLPALQGSIYAVVYTFLAIGLVGGWAAARTGSIWSSLISAILCNLVLVAFVL